MPQFTQCIYCSFRPIQSFSFQLECLGLLMKCVFLFQSKSYTLFGNFVIIGTTYYLHINIYLLITSTVIILQDHSILRIILFTERKTFYKKGNKVFTHYITMIMYFSCIEKKFILNHVIVHFTIIFFLYVSKYFSDILKYNLNVMLYCFFSYKFY